MRQLHAHGCSSRAGVSLMEVLISIGVVSIGLTGLLLLLPVAHHQAESGALNDRKANFGKRAVREFHVRGMARPERWRAWNGTEYIVPPVVTDVPFWHPEVAANLPPGTLLRVPICIDPRALAAVELYSDEANAQMPQKSVATDGFSSLTNASATGGELFLRNAFMSFPARADANVVYFVNGAPSMLRVSLAASADGWPVFPTQSDSTPPLSPQNPNAPLMMPKAQADLVFACDDDLDFLIPDDNALGPVQKSLRATVQTPLRRVANGRVSWFATLVPLLGAEPEAGLHNDNYRLSVAICEGRNVIAPERYVPVVVRHGFAGGDVVLATSTKVTAGQWVMLANRFTQNYRWYRVMHAEDRNVTLHGPDWRPAANVDATDADYLIVAPSVVNVYEKTIRLETSSLWTR